MPVTAGPKPGSLQFSLNNATDQDGDSVTDALCWVRQVAPPAWVFDPESWQPVIGAAVAAASARQGERHAFDQAADDLRGAGWATLSDALTWLIDDPADFVMPRNLQSVERAVLARTADALTRPDTTSSRLHSQLDDYPGQELAGEVLAAGLVTAVSESRRQTHTGLAAPSSGIGLEPE